MSVATVLQALERILLTLWAGGLWTTGFLFAPVLFRSFERMLAGDIAGHLFTAASLLGIVCGVLLIGLALVRGGWRVFREWRVAMMALMLTVTLIGEFGLAARMQEIKDIAVHHPDTPALWKEFGRLHGLASALFLLNSILGLTLVIAGVRPRTVQAGN